MSDAEIAQEAFAVLWTAYPDAMAPLRVTTSAWEDDPYCFGSYSFVTVGGSLDFSDDLAEPQGRLYFAGEHTNRAYPATVHGAYLSGVRAAESVAKHDPTATGRAVVRGSDRGGERAAVMHSLIGAAKMNDIAPQALARRRPRPHRRSSRAKARRIIAVWMGAVESRSRLSRGSPKGYHETRRAGSIAHSAGADGAVNGQQLSKQIGNHGKWREPGELGGWLGEASSSAMPPQAPTPKNFLAPGEGRNIGDLRTAELEAACCRTGIER